MRLTKFERTQLIGMRMEQLARGAPPTVDTSGLDNVRDIALRELHQRRMPLMVSRRLPCGKVDIVRLEDLDDVE